jgi:exosortase C (VPDSG-CTERM-specific)
MLDTNKNLAPLEVARAETTKATEVIEKRMTFRTRVMWLGLVSGLLIVAFLGPLRDLVEFSWANNLYSHILLIPFISVYLIWLRKGELVQESKPVAWWAGVPTLAIGAGTLAFYWCELNGHWHPPTEDYLALMVSSLLCLFWGSAFVCLGPSGMRQLAFPFAFLVFMIPLPSSVVQQVESWLQHGSAEVAYWLFSLSGTPVLRSGTFFQLPGLSLQVAPECSGIHSTLVLFISSLLGGYLLLRTGWRRTALALAVVPLAFLRNGFRIFVIGELCVNVSPEMINSYIHRKGGPIFFTLSLIPFFVLLLLLRRSEEKSFGPRNTRF